MTICEERQCIKEADEVKSTDDYWMEVAPHFDLKKDYLPLNDFYHRAQRVVCIPSSSLTPSPSPPPSPPSSSLSYSSPSPCIFTPFSASSTLSSSPKRSISTNKHQEINRSYKETEQTKNTTDLDIEDLMNTVMTEHGIPQYQRTAMMTRLLEMQYRRNKQTDLVDYKYP